MYAIFYLYSGTYVSERERVCGHLSTTIQLIVSMQSA